MHVCARTRMCAYKKRETYIKTPVTWILVTTPPVPYISTVPGILEGRKCYQKEVTMAERDIVAAIIRLLKKTPRCFCWKEHGGMYGTAGVPDIIACINGRFFAFEVKTETGKLSKLQETTIQRIKDAKGQAFTVRSAAEVAAILKNMEGGAL